MQKAIERATAIINKAIEKNRAEYAEADEWHRDTGYERYWKKMERLEKEYDELTEFFGDGKSKAAEAENARLRKENNELKTALTKISGMVGCIHADYWGDMQVAKLHETMRDLKYTYLWEENG